jgi:hypothetical protein
MTIHRIVVVAVVTSISVAGLHAAQEGASVAAARALIGSLDDAGLDAIATVDPTEPGAFVAALYIKGGQLLVVRAHHPSPEAISARIAARQYRDAYIDLQATPPTPGKLFVMDSGADGLPNDTDPPANVDVVYEDGTRQTMFNGARAQKLKDDEYRTLLQKTDVNYTRLLQVLKTAISSAEP